MATLFEHYTGATNFQRDDSNSSYIWAQSFTVGTVASNLGHQITQVDLKLFKNGTPSGNVIINIQGNTVGSPDHPDGNTLFTGTTAAASLTGTPTVTSITMTGGNSVQPSTKYWITMTGPVSGSNYVSLSSETGNPYAGGNVGQWNGSVWAAGVDDLYFAEYGNAVTTTTSNLSSSASFSTDNSSIAAFLPSLASMLGNNGGVNLLTTAILAAKAAVSTNPLLAGGSGIKKRLCACGSGNTVGSGVFYYESLT